MSKNTINIFLCHRTLREINDWYRKVLGSNSPIILREINVIIVICVIWFSIFICTLSHYKYFKVFLICIQEKILHEFEPNTSTLVHSMIIWHLIKKLKSKINMETTNFFKQTRITKTQPLEINSHKTTPTP
jgi:hypothetical protein